MKQSAILYARFSSMEQAKGLSLDRQLSEGRHYIEAKGWQLEQELVDKGRSAFSGANRAVGSELGKFEAEAREGLHAGKILVVENIDRLSRQGAKAAATFIWSLHEAGVSVATTQDSQFYNADSEENDLMEIFSIIIKAQLSHEESFKKAERAKFTWLTRHEKIKDGDKGTTAITPPAWIKAEGGRYVLNPERAKLLNEIYDLYIDGIGISKIVQMLNERIEPVWAVRKRDGKGGWREPYIHRLLRKRAVLGEYVTVNGETLAADYFPQAISAEKFNRVQAELAAKSKTGGHAYKRMSNLLSSLVVCGECGGNAAFENKGTNQIPHVKKNGERVIYNRKHYERLRCDNARRRNACTNKALLDYKIVEGCVLDHLGTLIGDPKSADAAQKANAEKIAETERQIAVKTKQIDNLLDALADGSKAVAERIVKYEAELEQLNEMLTQAQLATEIALSQPSPTAQLEVVEALRREINDSDEDKRFLARSKVNAALRRLIDKIMFSSDGNFLIYGNDAKIWLIFSKNGEEIGLYREVPDAPPHRLAPTNVIMNDELEAAQAEFQKLFQAI